jgi:hypothetical protein
MLNASNDTIQQYKSSYGITSQNYITAEWNMNAYNSVLTYGVLDSNTGSFISQAPAYRITTTNGTTALADNEDVTKMFPLSSVFDPIRPDLNILKHVVSTKYRNSTIDTKRAIIKSSSDIRANNLSFSGPRLYAAADDNRKIAYWSSIRNKINSSGNIERTGITDEAGSINDADVYITYSSSFYANKLTIRSQYYLGYPSNFDVYIATGSSSYPVWQKIYSYTGASANSPMSSGELNLYFDYTNPTASWTTASSSNTVVTDFDSDASTLQVKALQQIRFKVNKMYDPSRSDQSGIDLQLVEISPRIIADITNQTKEFDCNTQLSNSEYGLPVGGLISSTGNIKLSNFSKYFTESSTKSIIKNYLKPNVKFSFYQSTNSELIPIKTLYAVKWQETNDFLTEVVLEDYFKFFKEMQSPDLVIANNSGVPTSVALLMLLDNCGYGKYQFVKSASYADIEDTSIQFFLSKKENTVAQTLEELALSTQTSIFVNSKNQLIAMTKERTSYAIPAASANWWMTGDPEKVSASENEYSYLKSASYISNIQTFEEDKAPPITDIRIDYSGLGIQKESYELVQNEDLKDILDKNQLDSAPILSLNQKYATKTLWSQSNSPNENNLLTGLLVETLSSSLVPSMRNLQTASTIVLATDRYEAIRTYYQQNSASANLLKITLDKTTMIQFVQAESYSGTLMIDSEFIQYNGILFDIFNSSTKTSYQKILFNDRERVGILASLGNGSDMSPVSLIVALNFELENPNSKTLFDVNSKKRFKLISHGRGYTTYRKSEIADHEGSSNISLAKWKKFSNKLLDTSSYKSAVDGNFSFSLPVNINDSNQRPISYTSYPGYLKLSGLAFDAKTASGVVKSSAVSSSFYNDIPFNYEIDKFMTGIAYQSSDSYNVISTRIRILSTSNFTGNIETIVGKDVQDLSGIAGIFFGLSGSGTTSCKGYFVEIQQSGAKGIQETIAADQSNLKLYKITASTTSTGSIYLAPVVLGYAAVAQAASKQATVDVRALTSGDSFTTISDLRVVVSSNEINVFWEGQNVISYQMNSSTESPASIFNGSTQIGMFTRGNTIALFEHFLAANTDQNVIDILINNSKNTIPIADAAERGVLSSAVKIVNGKNQKFFFEDFGRQARQIRQFNVRYDYPALYSEILDFGSVNTKYYICDFKKTSFGAKFWILNTTTNPIVLGQESSVPVVISGFALSKVSEKDSFVSMEDYIKSRTRFTNTDSNNNVISVTSEIEKSKFAYGENTLNVNGQFISTYQEAYSLLSWLVENYIKEKRIISMSVFANPLLEIGDRVKVYYQEKGYTDLLLGEKSFIIDAIQYSVDDSGPTMSVSLRELM